MEAISFILLMFGVFFIGFSMILKTNNISSSIFFKVIPFFGGCFNIFVAFYLLGWISINISIME